MNKNTLAYACFCLAIAVGVARSDQPEVNLPPIPENGDAAVKDKEKQKPKPPDEKKPITEPPKTDVFNLPPVMGNQFATGFNPHMMGDLPGFFAQRIVTVTGTQTTTTTTTRRGPNGTNQVTVATATQSVSKSFTVLTPVASSGAFKVAENASPRPVDRVFFTYNYFSDIRDPLNSAIESSSVTQTSTRTGRIGSATTAVETIFPGLPRATANLNREVVGFEKTFLGGDASIELRLPILQQSANIDGFSSQGVGDLTIVTKYAFINDRDTGNVLSAGLVITAPTGNAVQTIDGDLQTTLLQPWFGYIVNGDRFFLHAFHSIVIPTDSNFGTLLFNDVGVNFWLYRGDRDRALNFIVPMIEAHVTTPLSNRDPAASLYIPDVVVLTGGAHIGLFGNSTLSLGVATPVTGPRIYNVEAFAQFNLRF
jgi:hypothetical protein